MAWKGREDVETDYSQLQASLNTSGYQKKNPAVFQVISQLIQFLQRNKGIIQKKLEEINNSINIAGVNINNINNLLKFATFWTRNDETVNLPASFRVIAGPGINLDYSIPNQVTITSTSNSDGYWTPLTDGDTDETDLIFANGEAIAVFVPVP